MRMRFALPPRCCRPVAAAGARSVACAWAGAHRVRLHCVTVPSLPVPLFPRRHAFFSLRLPPHVISARPTRAAHRPTFPGAQALCRCTPPPATAHRPNPAVAACCCRCAPPRPAPETAAGTARSARARVNTLTVFSAMWHSGVNTFTVYSAMWYSGETD